MSLLDSVDTSLFVAPAQRQAQMDYGASLALGRGLSQFTQQQYDGAITTFQRAISMSPTSDTALNAYDYMARAYLAKGDVSSAVATYTRALRVAPHRDDFHTQLGNIYIERGDTKNAVAHYEQAVKYNPTASTRYSLGQGYLAAEDYDKAAAQFRQVKQLDKPGPHGEYGLGLVYAKTGKYDRAVAEFQLAISKKSDYWQAHAEIGYALADSGDLRGARQTADALASEDSQLSAQLGKYIYKLTQPSMVASYLSSSAHPFVTTAGPRTKVAGLGEYLNQPNALQTVGVEFQFNKAMDRNSVENVYNWNIARSVGTGAGDGYNFDMPAPATEVTLRPTPASVYYDVGTQIATVMFTLQQNQAGDGTIDPSHIQFSFSGRDVTGLSMNSSADSYTGFSGFA